MIHHHMAFDKYKMLVKFMYQPMFVKYSRIVLKGHCYAGIHVFQDLSEADNGEF